MSASFRRRKLFGLLGAIVLAMLCTVSTTRAGNTSLGHSNTQLTVMSFVTLSGVPALIDFGSGSPGVVSGGPGFGDGSPAEGVVAPSFIAVVRTNNSSGYTLLCLTSDMAAKAADMRINAQQVAYQVVPTGLGHGDGGTVTNADSSLILAHSDRHSIAAGDGYAITPSLIIPFVPTGTYQGTVTFEAVDL